MYNKKFKTQHPKPTKKSKKKKTKQNKQTNKQANIK